MADQRQNQVRRPEMDKRWNEQIEERILEIVGRTGSPKMAAQELGIGVSTIHDHRRRDREFGARYAEAMNCAFNQVLSKAFERSLDEINPSDRLIEALLKFRFVDKATSLSSGLDDDAGTPGPFGLSAKVVALMEPSDRAALAGLLARYIEKAGDLALEVGANGQPIKTIN